MTPPPDGPEPASGAPVVALAPSPSGGAEGTVTTLGAAPAGTARHRSNLRWAQLMARSFGCDVLACAPVRRPHAAAGADRARTARRWCGAADLGLPEVGTTLWTPLMVSEPVIPSLVRLADHAFLADLRQGYPFLDFVPLEDYYRPPSQAMAVACLVAAGAALAYIAVLATVSTAMLERAELGFEPTNVLEVSFPGRLLPGQDDGRATAFQRWLDVGDVPGVVSSALANGRRLSPRSPVEERQSLEIRHARLLTSESTM